MEQYTQVCAGHNQRPGVCAEASILSAALASITPRTTCPTGSFVGGGQCFKKVSKLDPEKLRVKSISGIALLVDAIGGSWGSTELEERYEFFEKSLYGTIQRSDESHDSYLARFEANFTELISRETKLEEVQAYVLLRQSTNVAVAVGPFETCLEPTQDASFAGLLKELPD